MGYGRFMGYVMHFPVNQLGGHKMLWGLRGYGFSEVWVKRGSTVFVVEETRRRNSVGRDQSGRIHILSEICIVVIVADESSTYGPYHFSLHFLHKNTI